MSKEDIIRLLPEKKKTFTKDLSLGVVDMRDSQWDLSHNQALTAFADALAKAEVTVEDIWGILIEAQGCKPDKEDCSYKRCLRHFQCEAIKTTLREEFVILRRKE